MRSRTGTSRQRFRRIRPSALLLIGLLLTAPDALGQSVTNIANRSDLAERISAAFDRDDYADAARLCDTFLEHWPNHPVMLYNAACAYAQLGETERAADFLFRSVERGFTDFGHIERDPDLDPLREHPVYIRLLEARDEAYARVAEKQLRRAREQFGGEGYLYEVDTEHRLTYAVALDEVSFREMREMLAKQADQLSESLFEAPPDYFVLVAVPLPADGDRLIRNGSIGGIYEHGHKRLVARDIGMMLRHEFTHVMHYGHMSRLNQPHALWIQEGIASLYESYRIDEDGGIEFMPNNRHNLVKRLVERNRYTRWDQLLSMPAERFMDKAGATYPQVRSMFRWLADRGDLVRWYRAYVEHFEEDRTGKAAFKALFDEPLELTERRWRNWVKGQPWRDEFVQPGDASLGIRLVFDAHNDGVEIEEVMYGSAAEAAGLRVGDVIVSIDGRATRSPVELQEIIAARQVGDHVRVRYRREGQYRTVSVTLKPMSHYR